MGFEPMTTFLYLDFQNRCLKPTQPTTFRWARVELTPLGHEPSELPFTQPPFRKSWI